MKRRCNSTGSPSLTDEHQLGNAGRLGQLVVAVLDAAAFHREHFDVTADPAGPLDLQVAKQDILTGDVAVDALADRAVG